MNKTPAGVLARKGDSTCENYPLPGGACRGGLDAWEYEYRDYSETVVLSISIGGDGVVREVMRIRRGCV